MPIFDLSQNALPLATPAQLIGFTEPAPVAEVLNVNMYDFLIQPIRTEDQLRGNLFVKRFLDGPQIVWREIQEAIFKIKDLWNVDDIPDEFLKYLKNIVGWTSELDHITDRLDDRQLRQLIRASGVLWKTRGPEASVQNILRQLTGTRLRLWNWFDYRWVIDETGMGEEHDGRDPWMIGAPGEGLNDEFRFNIRIVDNGLLDRTLVEDVVKLMRPNGERVEIAFIDFLDLFLVDDDTQQWEVATGDFTVTGGSMMLDDSGSNQEVHTNDSNAELWKDIVAFWRVRGTSSFASADFGGFFCHTDPSNTYYWAMDTFSNTLEVGKLVAGVPTVLASAPLAGIPLTLFADVFYGIRVEAIDIGGGTTQIKLFIDNIEVINTTDTEYSTGNLGMFSRAGAIAEFDEIEMFQHPLELVEVDINS